MTLFEDTLLCSAQEVLGLKKCVQVRRHAWWTPELRLLIDRRRATYIEARRAQARRLETWPTLFDWWRALRTEVKAIVRTAKQKLWRDQMHSCNDLLRLMRPGLCGSCSVGAHLVSAYQPLLTMSP